MSDKQEGRFAPGLPDRTVTAMGACLLKQWLSYPLAGGTIRQRLSAVEELTSGPTLEPLATC